MSDKPARRPAKFFPSVRELAYKVYANTASIADVAGACGVSTRTIKLYLQNDPEFRENMDTAREQFVAKLEKAAVEQAKGIIQTTPGPGGIWYDKTVYSPQLMIHLLKRLSPDKHGDKVVHEHKAAALSMGLESLSLENLALVEQILKNELKQADVREITIENEEDDQ
jgi:hypothetical protein